MTYTHPTWREVVRQVDALANENDVLKSEVKRLKLQLNNLLNARAVSEEEYIQLCEIRKNETS